MQCLVIFHLVQLALLLLFSCSIFCCTCAASFFLPHSFAEPLLLLLFCHIIFSCSCAILFSLLQFLLFLNRGFFFALSCCSCVASSFVTVPVSALATEEYPTVKSAIARSVIVSFSFYFSPFYTFYITSHRMYH